jgi:hypothetical protein
MQLTCAEIALITSTATATMTTSLSLPVDTAAGKDKKKKKTTPKKKKKQQQKKKKKKAAPLGCTSLRLLQLERHFDSIGYACHDCKSFYSLDDIERAAQRHLTAMDG